jgi:hypothetical protein
MYTAKANAMIIDAYIFISKMESLSSMKTLQRLCHQKGSSNTGSNGSSDNRLSIYADDNSIEELLGKQLEQPYKLIVSAFDNESFEGFAKGINWIKLLMHSGYVLQPVDFSDGSTV